MDSNNEYPTIFVGVDKKFGKEPIVKANGKLLGTAREVSALIERGALEAERERAIPSLHYQSVS